MIRSRLELRDDLEVGADQRRPYFGDKLLPRSFAAILRIAAQISANTTRVRRPVNMLMTLHRHVRCGIAETLERRHLDGLSTANRTRASRHAE